MIQQHLLQQQRLNNNHERLLERYSRVPNPKMSEFRPFGTSALPGRNYDQYLFNLNGNNGYRNSLVEQSRASIGSSSETYRLMGNEQKEVLPNTVSTTMQYSGQQSKPLVHAEKFEPVHVYEHPTFGPTPAYIRPIFNEKSRSDEIEDDLNEKYQDSDDEPENFDSRSHTSVNSTVKTNKDAEEKAKPPLGYISYRDWKKKYEHLIPVNPLLFNIYTKRPNGSLQKYGQTFYVSPPRHHQSPDFNDDDDDDELLTRTTSEVDTYPSDVLQESSVSSKQKYNRLQSQLPTTTTTFSRPLGPIHPTNDSSSDEESASRASPVSFLSRKQGHSPMSIPMKPSINPPRTITPLMSTSFKNEIETASTKLSTNLPKIPSPPSIQSSVAAPPLSSSSTVQYEKPVSVTSASIPVAPPLPDYLKASSSAITNHASTNNSAPTTLTSTKDEATGSKAVTFGGAPNTLTADDAVSNSSDTDDEDKRKRQKRQGIGRDGNDSSSSDD